MSLFVESQNVKEGLMSKLLMGLKFMVFAPLLWAGAALTSGSVTWVSITGGEYLAEKYLQVSIFIVNESGSMVITWSGIALIMITLVLGAISGLCFNKCAWETVFSEKEDAADQLVAQPTTATQAS